MLDAPSRDGTRREQRVVLAIAIAGVFIVIPLSLVVAPDAANFRAPMTQRIFYYHVPSAWVAYLAFAVTAFASARFLLDPKPAHDRLAAASAEVGLVFSAIALATGLLWSSVEFTGYSAFEDVKVISLVVLMLAYAAYLTLRAGVEDPAKRGRLSAAFGLLAVVSVPLSYFASKLSIHPDFTRPESDLAPELGMILGVSTALFTLVYAALAWHRVRVAAIEDALDEARARLQEGS